HILLGESLGVPVDKLNLVVVWREAPQFSSRECAALAWTEALTLLTEGVSDEVFAEVSAEFSEKELAYLSSAIASINVWNRLGVAYRWTPLARQKLLSRRLHNILPKLLVAALLRISSENILR